MPLHRRQWRNENLDSLSRGNEQHYYCYWEERVALSLKRRRMRLLLYRDFYLNSLMLFFSCRSSYSSLLSEMKIKRAGPLSSGDTWMIFILITEWSPRFKVGVSVLEIDVLLLDSCRLLLGFAALFASCFWRPTPAHRFTSFLIEMSQRLLLSHSCFSRIL